MRSSQLKIVFLASAILAGAASLAHAQSMPNYGANAPANADSFGQPPTGTKPPGVARYGHRAYAYRPHGHRHWYWRHHHRYWY